MTPTCDRERQEDGARMTAATQMLLIDTVTVSPLPRVTLAVAIHRQVYPLSILTFHQDG